ncbi:hypothetical protein H6G80_32660 [Nostoc sp. FACHB-87]|uniref:hypothetical protein n=1 Tax=unclassified Nostoc TaxID=2593658 RepID=UPI001688D478|nr:MULTISPECIES: hypothetical protein [unclassified Nostoc]MBD2303169.1 hypothetical protein [Nostoc sp. FACHB-190]MBD2458797.1 hypothetical protein [Nostoc sp. FACHB-87]MBD2480173.1 hypothetical protein [Anabaena sp. FACHB-83]
MTLLPFLIIFQFFSFDSNPILGILFIIFYVIIVFPVYVNGLTILTEGYVLGENPQIDVAIKRILSRIIPLTGLSIRFGIICFLLSLLLIIPGIIYAVNNSYYGQAFILRGQTGKAAFEYSRSLVKGNWWKVFLLSIISSIIISQYEKWIAKILNRVLIDFPALVAIIGDIISINLVAAVTIISGVLLFLNLEFQKQLR